MPPPPPPDLLEELLEEVLLRVPPDDPALLFRAALACKRWCRLISGPRFRRRFREFHGAPPLLGAICNQGFSTRFWAASSFRPPYAAYRHRSWAIDARHGRILYISSDLVVSDPIRGQELKIPFPRSLRSFRSWSLALLCAAPGCDHLDCPSAGPFTVVFAGTDLSEEFTSASVYSSEAGSWSETTSVEHPPDYVFRYGSALVGNAIYFRFTGGGKILEYDLRRQELAVITLPFKRMGITLMTAEDGGIGFAYVEEFKLYMWSSDANLNRWAQRRVIDLRSLLPVSALSTSLKMIAFEYGADVIFTYVHGGSEIFAIHPNLGRATKVRTGGCVHPIFPYMNFYTPALQAASGPLHVDGSGPGPSSA